MNYREAMALSTRFTAKYRHYASLYDQVLTTLPRAPTVLEIGIANGGSLQTWRTLLGSDARIIGVDLNERCRQLETEGFEIHLLDTGTPEAWAELRTHLSRSVDLLVDDGGHTNRQQIAALIYGVDLVRDGGWLVVEDLHASFMSEFGNPSPFSTARFLNQLTSDLHMSHPRSGRSPKRPHLADAIEYTVTATSWVGLRINRDASDRCEISEGQDRTLMDYDHRWDSSVGGRIKSVLPPWTVRLLSNRWTRRLGAVSDRRLFRSDASEG